MRGYQFVSDITIGHKNSVNTGERESKSSLPPAGPITARCAFCRKPGDTLFCDCATAERIRQQTETFWRKERGNANENTPSKIN